MSRIRDGSSRSDRFRGIASYDLSLRLFPRLEVAFQKASIPFQVIGKVRQGPARVLTKAGKEIHPLRETKSLISINPHPLPPRFRVSTATLLRGARGIMWRLQWRQNRLSKNVQELGLGESVQ